MQQVVSCIDTDTVESRLAELCTFPRVDADRSLLEMVRGASANAVLKRLVGTYESQIRSWNRDVFCSLRDAHSFADWGDASWNSSVGLVRDAMSRGVFPPESAVIGLALMLAQTGAAAQWRVRPKSPLFIVFGYQWLRCEESVELRSDGQDLVIIVDGRPHRFRRCDRLWQPVDDSTNKCDAAAFPLVLSAPTFDVRHVVQHIFSNWPHGSVGAGSIEESVAVRTAFGQLETYAPDYAGWVRNAVSIVVVVDPKGPMLVGGSSASRPGLIIVSKAKPMEVVEALVHEATHQYLCTLTILDELHNGSDRREYFSPLRQEMRPFNGILSAYHVLCNLLILFENLLRSGIPYQSEYSARLKSIRAGLRAIDPVVYQNSSLTELGATVCRILHRRIEHALD